MVKRIVLESSSICQLRCPVCSTAKGMNKNNIIGEGFLKFSDFKKIIEENPEIENIDLSNRGEPFLNPDILKIIKFGFQKKIRLDAETGTNLNYASDKILEGLVKYKFEVLKVSIDGASNETYSIYRKYGNFEKVIENIKKINRFKKIYGSKYPKLIWQFIIFGHNEHEIPKAKKMAQELNMEFKFQLNHTKTYSPIKDIKFVKEASGLNAVTRDEFRQKKGKNYVIPCLTLWTKPRINWNGEFLGCCINTIISFGNVFEKRLSGCLNSEKYRYTKRFLLGLESTRKDIPCFNCKYYDPKVSEILKEKGITEE